MIFIDIMLSFINYRGKMFKNIQNLRKLALETCVCVSQVFLACLDVFEVFVLVKLILKILELLSFIYILEISEYDSPKALHDC